MKSAEQRIRKYAAKLSGDVAKARIDAQRGPNHPVMVKDEEE